MASKAGAAEEDVELKVGVKVSAAAPYRVVGSVWVDEALESWQGQSSHVQQVDVGDRGVGDRDDFSSALRGRGPAHQGMVGAGKYGEAGAGGIRGSV